MTRLEDAIARFQRAEIELRAAAHELRHVIGERVQLAARVAPRFIDPRVATILSIVAAHEGLQVADLLIKSKAWHICLPRQRAMMVLRKLLKSTLQNTAAVFGFDHGTVLHAQRAVAAQCETDPRYRRNYELLLAKCADALSKSFAA